MTYELKIENGKTNILYSGGELNGLKEYYTGVARQGYTNIAAAKWSTMLNDLLTPGGSIITRMRATAKGSVSMSVEYSTVMIVLQNGVNGFPDEDTLQALLRMNWGFTNSEKTTLNNYFSNNNFSITVT